jgi:hypothetical protein
VALVFLRDDSAVIERAVSRLSHHRLLAEVARGLREISGRAVAAA